ncbi:UNVERIFIED_CONTAM: hypothetical protein FKN15_030727 [Acipenser sinensis]
MGKWTADMQPEAYFEEGYAPVRAVIRLPCVPSSWLLQPLSRFSGQSDWIRPNSRGRFSWDFMEFRDVPIEEVDASGTEINYRGLDNLDVIDIQMQVSLTALLVVLSQPPSQSAAHEKSFCEQF